MNKNIKQTYNLLKTVRDKETKILNYYKRINNLEQTKIHIIPKRRKLTKKQLPKIEIKDTKDTKDTKEEDRKIDTDRILEQPAKKITQKRLVVMDD